jgi:hypothetical protein
LQEAESNCIFSNIWKGLNAKLNTPFSACSADQHLIIADFTGRSHQLLGNHILIPSKTFFTGGQQLFLKIVRCV